MSKNTDYDALAAFATLNPVSAERIAVLEESPARERIYALILARAAETVADERPRRPRRLAIAVVSLALLLAFPALALSGQLGSLFGFANTGSSVETSNLRRASALDLTGARPGTLKLLASRAGVGFYAARTRSGGRCYFLGSPNRSDERELSGGCLNTEASARFPSPAMPIVDMSAFIYRPYASGEEVSRLAGVAADGVAKVEVLGDDCSAIGEAPVIGNVYVDTKVSDKPAVGIEALDNSGKRLYLEKLRFWDKSACTYGNGS
jgi:hypothetical protein